MTKALFNLDAPPLGKAVFVVDIGFGIALLVDKTLLAQLADNVLDFFSFKSPLMKLFANVSNAMFSL